MRQRTHAVVVSGIVFVLACGEGLHEGDGAATLPPWDATGDTAAASTGDADDSSSGDAACLGPFTYGPATSWGRYGLDAANSRHNAAERAITTASVGCLEPRWTIDGLRGVTSTPAVEGGVVYFGDWDGALHAHDRDTGDPIWVTPLGVPTPPDTAVAIDDSPLVHGTRVFVGDADGVLHAVDRTTGAVDWSLELDVHPDASLYGSPVVVGPHVVIGVASTELATLHDDYTFRGSLVAVDANTGTIEWRRSMTPDDDTAGAGVSVWSTPAVDAARNLLYVGTGNTYEPPAAPLSDALLAIDADTGAIVWSRQFTAGDVYTIFMPEPQGVDADIGAAPNLFTIDGRDVVGVGDKAGVYAVLDRDDGETVWATRIGPGSHLGGIMTTAAVGDDTIYVANNTWVGSIFDFGSDENSAIVVALDASTGELRWQRPMPRPIFGALTLAGDVVWHGTIDGVVHALDASTGVELWSAAPGGDDPDAGIGGGVSVVDGTVFVGYGFWFFTEPAGAHGGLAAYGLPG